MLHWIRLLLGKRLLLPQSLVRLAQLSSLFLPPNTPQDGSTKGFLANEQAGKHYPNCGADDDQADAIVHAMVVVALMAGQPDMLPTIANIIRVTQNTDQAVAFGLGAARILEAVS